MKKVLFILLAVLVGNVLQAQTFSVVNDDGVSISYTVVSDETVEVARDASYTGNIVVPSTVNYEGTEYTVIGVAMRAFYNSSVRYVRLPETLMYLRDMCFLRCNQLDSVRFDCEAPVTSYQGSPLTEVVSSQLLYDVRFIVPCGQLQMWKDAGWRQARYITSDCAHRMKVTANYDSIVRYDSLFVNNNVFSSNGYYETGDVAWLRATRFNWKNSSNALIAGPYGYFLGWSDGERSSERTMVMPDHDVEIEVICDTMPYATLAASRVSTPVYVFGTMGYDGSVTHYKFRDIHYTDEEGIEVYPSTVFNSSIWMATQNRSAVSRFFTEGTDFYPGPVRLDGTTDLETARRFSRVWHVTREMIDYHIAHCGEEGYEIPDDIMTWPGTGCLGSDYASELAPFYDADGNGRYWAPAGDYPLIRGDECVFSIYNDVHSGHTLSNSEPLGVEVHVMTYSFNEPQDTALWNTVFQHYDIYNRSNQGIEDVYLGMWTDFDIGYAWDDFIGCDVQQNMYYGYNGTANDQMFGNNHPAQGCIILSTDDDPGMTSFLAYDNTTSSLMGEPTTTSDYYNYLQGNMKNGDTPWYGASGACHYMYPAGSDPDFGSYVDEISQGNAPGDRRGVGGSGPYTIASGACQSFDAAYLTAWSDELDCVGCSRNALVILSPNVRRQWLHDTTDSGRPFLYMPYSAPHEVGIDGVEAATLQVWPNPTTGCLTVNLPVEADVQVYDMMGRQLMSRHASEGTLSLDLGSLPQGVYLLRAAGGVSRIVKR